MGNSMKHTPTYIYMKQNKAHIERVTYMHMCIQCDVHFDRCLFNVPKNFGEN